MSIPRAFWGRPRAHAPRSVGKTLLANARADNLRRTLNYRNELHIVQTLRSAQPQPFVRRRPGERNRVFGPTGPSEYAAVRSQALLILAIPDHAPRAGQLGLAIRAMSCSAAPCAPTSAASSRSAASSAASGSSRSTGSACTHASRGRRQRKAENQDSARERVSESASLFATKLKKDVHGNGPRCSGESPGNTFPMKFIRLPLRRGGLLLKAPRARRPPAIASEPDAPRGAASRRARVPGRDAPHAESRRRGRR
jgi:hypothetical protein